MLHDRFFLFLAVKISIDHGYLPANGFIDDTWYIWRGNRFLNVAAVTEQAGGAYAEFDHAVQHCRNGLMRSGRSVATVL